jgi:hypothetical protein
MHDPSGHRPESPWVEKIERAAFAFESGVQKFERFIEQHGSDWATALLSPPSFVFGVMLMRERPAEPWQFLVSLVFLALGASGIYHTLQKLGWIDGDWLRGNNRR